VCYIHLLPQTTSTQSDDKSESRRADQEAFESQSIYKNSNESTKVSTNIMLTDSAATALTGAAFGASLAASGVYLPSVIIDQFRLTDFHMFQVFATAMGSSA
jgi:hypothetical protein